MLIDQLIHKGIRDQRVLQAFGEFDRRDFVPAELKDQAYDDCALPIGFRQTISQPYIVALMIELAQPKPGDIAMDVGTGSGYQAAILSKLVKHVYSIEIVPELARTAQQRLNGLGVDNVSVHVGDARKDLLDQSPFDIILVAAAPQRMPSELLNQLAIGGRMVVPIGEKGSQDLWLVEKERPKKFRKKLIAPVAFVPMTGSESNNR